MNTVTGHDRSAQGRAARVLLRAMMIVLGASLVATVSWAVATVVARPLDGVEGDVLFEADRIRTGLPLYTDPVIGAREYGSPPSRYLVLYPPLWSAVLSLVPRAADAVIGRLLATAAWFGEVALLVWKAPKERRRIVALGGAFVAGIWVLALYGANARPDAVAVLASGLALERAARLSAGTSVKSESAQTEHSGQIDVLSGVLFALAVWTKPNVLGAAPGAFLGCLVASRGRMRAILPGLAGALATSVVAAGVLHVVSGGAWLEHLLASTGQPPNDALWLGQIAERGPFFLLPLLATLMLGVRARRDPGAAIATGALATSTAWAIVSLAKIGSASNYFMEPCVAMLVVLARVDLPDMTARSHLAVAALGVLQMTWNGASSIVGATMAVPAAFARARAVADVRHVCGATPDGVVLADEPGLELALDGRLVATPFQTTHLVRRGRFPVTEWLKDIASPRVECLVMQDDLLERDPNDDGVARDRFSPELRRAMNARFELVAMRAGYRIYRSIDRASSRSDRASEAAPPIIP